MEQMEWTYSEEENGWATAPLRITGRTWVEAELQRGGYVTIVKAEEEGGEYIPALVSDYADRHEIRIYGHTKYPWIKVITSEQPKSIRYANI